MDLELTIKNVKDMYLLKVVYLTRTCICVGRVSLKDTYLVKYVSYNF